MSQVVGVDLGGTKINTVLMNSKGKVLKRVKVKTSKTKEQIINQIINSIDKVSKNKKIKGVGVGVPGILDKKREKVIILPNIPKFKNVNLKKIIESKTKKRVLIRNDGNCTALGISRFGLGKKYKNFVYVTIGTGVGGGIIINKKLYTGRGNAAEFGHLTVEQNGIKCNCGNTGCLEKYVSGRGIERISRNLGLKKDIYEINKLARKGNKKAKKAYAIAGEYLGIGLSGIIKRLDPEIIIIGGGVSHSGNLLLKPALKEVKKRALFKPCPIKLIKFGDDAGAIGAASLFLR